MQPQSEPPAPKQSKIASILGTMFSKDGSGLETNTIVVPRQEVDHYIKLATPSLDTCPLQWWQTNSLNLPTLSKFARKLLSIQATSVPSERLFSDAGELVSSRRSRLSAINIDMLLFVHNNLGL